jgi:hypothetical protein
MTTKNQKSAATKAQVRDAASTALSKAVASYVTAESKKAVLMLQAIQTYMQPKIDAKADLAPAFKHMNDVIKAAAKKAAKTDTIPATIRSYTSQLSTVFNSTEKGDGIDFIMKAQTLNDIRKRSVSIIEANRDTKTSAGNTSKGKGGAGKSTVKLDPIEQAIIDRRAALKANKELDALSRFDHMLSEFMADTPKQAPKAPAKPKAPKATKAATANGATVQAAKALAKMQVPAKAMQ